ncbi:MAG: ABC-2 family transporter protein [Bacillota bacterium]
MQQLEPFPRGPTLLAHYLKVYTIYVRAGWLALMAYPVDFTVRNLGNLAWNLAAVGAIWLIFTFTGSIRGFDRAQVLFIYAMSMLARSIWHLLWVDMMSVGGYVQRGELDRLLVRPLDPLFQVVAGYLDHDDWGELALGLMVLALAGRSLGLGKQPLLVAWTALAVLCGSLVYAAVHLAAASTAFWMVRNSAVTSLAWDIDSFSRYPLDIYPAVIRLALTWVVPFGFAAYYPSQLVLATGTHRYLAALTPVVAVAAFAGAYRFWQSGLSRYQGTGH